MSGAEQFNIGEAASRSGVLAKMVLHCDSLGLLPAVARTERLRVFLPALGI